MRGWQGCLQGIASIYREHIAAATHRTYDARTRSIIGISAGSQGSAQRQRPQGLTLASALAGRAPDQCPWKGRGVLQTEHTRPCPIGSIPEVPSASAMPSTLLSTHPRDRQQLSPGATRVRQNEDASGESRSASRWPVPRSTETTYRGTYSTSGGHPGGGVREVVQTALIPSDGENQLHRSPRRSNVHGGAIVSTDYSLSSVACPYAA